MVKNINILIISRFLIIVGILLTIFIFNFLYPTSINIAPLLNITLLIVLLSGIYFFLNLNTSISKDFLIQLQLFIDIIVISALIYVTGSTQSPFLFLLTIPIIISSIYLNKTKTVLIGVLSFLSLIVIITLYYTSFYGDIHIELILSRVILYGLSFTGIALLSAYLVERIRLYREEIEEKEIEFERLNLLLQNIVENIEYAFITLDEKGDLIFKNREADSLLSHNLLKYLRDSFNVKNKGAFELELEDKILKVKYDNMNFENKHYHIFVIEDLTEEKKQERERQIRERLLYLGEIAAGMAHEIRNPLASLMASLQLIEEGKLENISLLTSIIVDDIKRISSIIEDFLIFTENRNFKIEELELEKQIVKVIKDLNRDGYKTDTIKFKIDKKVEKYKGNSYHLSLILKNLLTNSIKAVKNKGDISVKIYLDEKRMEMRVTDSGSGIEKKDLKNIFNPFFTKSEGKGMGIGLTIVKRIVELYNGTIEVFSEKGKGTEYIITLPQKKKIE